MTSTGDRTRRLSLLFLKTEYPQPHTRKKEISQKKKNMLLVEPRFLLIGIVSLLLTSGMVLSAEALSLEDPRETKTIDNLLVGDLSGLSRRELLTIPVALSGAVFYGRLLSDATRRVARGDLVYPASHERRVSSTISEAVVLSAASTMTIPPPPPSSGNNNEDATTIGQQQRPLRILEVGIGRDCRVVRRGLYDDAFAKVASLDRGGGGGGGVTNIELIGVDVVSPTSTAVEKARDVLQRQKEENNVDVSFRSVTGDLSSESHRLDFADGHFDCVLCFLTLCSVEDQVAALREIKRVLRKDGGVFGYVEHVAVDPDEPYRILELQQRALDGLQQRVADNCHLHRFTESAVASVFGISDEGTTSDNGAAVLATKERFLVDDMWPVSCQTRGVVRLNQISSSSRV